MTAAPKVIRTAVSVSLDAAPSLIVRSGEQVGVLGDPPAPDHRHHRPHRQGRSAAALAAPEQHQDPEAERAEAITSGSASLVRPS